MIDEIDEGLRELLIDELPIAGDEIDISFETPKRDWSSRLSRPTINLFLYDIREDQHMRTAVPNILPLNDPANRATVGMADEAYAPIWVKLNYMVTVWAADPADEHRLITRVMLAFFRHPYLDNEYLPSEDLESLPTIQAAQHHIFQDSDRLWSALDNDLKAAISCTVSFPVSPFQPFSTPVVRSLDLGFGQSFEPRGTMLDASDDEFWIVGGIVTSAEPFQSPRLVLVDVGLDIPIEPDGRYNIGRLREGDYEIMFVDIDREAGPYTLTVPSDHYNIDI